MPYFFIQSKFKITRFHKNILLILFYTVSANLLCGCNSKKTIIQVFHNQEWDQWQKERHGYTSGRKILSSDPYFLSKLPPDVSSKNNQCNEVMVDFNKDDSEKIEIESKGFFILKKVDNSKYMNFIHVADVEIEDVGDTNTNLQEVWKLTSLTDDWDNNHIKVLNPFPGCKIPRNSVIGDILKTSDGKQYIVDTIGFSPYSDIMKSDSISIIK